MTVAVVAKIPWGIRLSDPAALLFATDTRFSFRSGRPPADHAQKLFRLHDRLAGVYSGATEPAEDAYAQLRRMFRRVKAVKREDVLSLCPQCFRDHFANRSHKHLGLEVLIGGRQEDGTGFVFHLSHRSEFTPIELSGEPFAIGEGAALFRAGLKEAIRQTQEAGVPALNWAALVAAVIDDMIQKRKLSSVGGKVALAAIGSDPFGEIPIEVGKGPDADHIQFFRTATTKRKI